MELARIAHVEQMVPRSTIQDVIATRLATCRIVCSRNAE
jgi:hypothetical protein